MAVETIENTYGSIRRTIKKVKGTDVPYWVITHAEPHVCIKLKSIFTHIRKSSVPPYEFIDTPENCFDLMWFMERYPLDISAHDAKMLAKGKKIRVSTYNAAQRLLLPEYKSSMEVHGLNEGCEARQYQLKGNEFFSMMSRFLLGDEIGLGKTLTAILSFLPAKRRPVAVVMQTHMPKQWEGEVHRFTGLRVHLVKTRKPYDLPEADVYIFKYSSLCGWTNLFTSGFFKTVVFDEVQELRHNGTDKYDAAYILSTNAQYVMGMSGTPIYNYGDEIFNILDLIKPNCLGDRYSFMLEWTSDGKRVKEPAALGTFLRDSLLMLRRTRKDVGRELPPVNKIVYTVEHDEAAMDKDLELAKVLAMRVVSGGFMERGQASRDLDILARHATGVAKAKSVAAFVRILLDSGEPVVLAAWHREVYDILLKELSEYNPVMYTGSESVVQKERAKSDFISGKTKLFIISLRSGIGLDGLQHVCNTVVFAELDWSNAVMGQVIGRVDRDGQGEQVTAYYLVSDGGSDPVLIDVLGLKASQQHGIMDPLELVPQQYSGESRIKMLAQQYLDRV